MRFADKILAHLAPLDIGDRIDVDTSQEPDLDDVLRAIRGVLARNEASET